MNGRWAGAGLGERKVYGDLHQSSVGAGLMDVGGGCAADLAYTVMKKYAGILRLFILT